MKPNSTLRKEALRHLDGSWGTFVLMTFLCAVISVICQIPSQVSELLFKLGTSTSLAVSLYALSFALLLCLIPMTWSYTVSFLKHSRGESVEIGSIFSGYSDFIRVLGTMFLQNLYTLLWSLLLIVPGIVKYFSYAMTPYILLDHPELQYNSAIELSMRMMRGNKMRLFMLYLSFIGWAILALFTCGIGFFWLEPYVEASVAAFYEDVRADYEANYAFNDEHQTDYLSRNDRGTDF